MAVPKRKSSRSKQKISLSQHGESCHKCRLSQEYLGPFQSRAKLVIEFPDSEDSCPDYLNPKLARTSRIETPRDLSERSDSPALRLAMRLPAGSQING